MKLDWARPLGGRAAVRLTGVPEVHSARLPGRPRHNPCVPELEPGDEFAGCRIEAVAGRGGMGVVYRATELSLGRPVALKLLAPDRAGDREFRERFQREWRMAASIDHPNVIPVYGAGEHDGSLYLVMRYVGGTDLHALLREQGRARARRARPSWWRSWRRRSTPRTPPGSCTATSSPPTCCWPATTPT